MSCMESKFVVRGKIHGVTGINKESLEYLTYKFGKPTDFYDDNDWYYEATKDNRYSPIYDWDTKQWFIDYTLKYHSEYKTYVEPETLTLSLLKTIVGNMLEKCGDTMTEEDIVVVAYDWYNGGDEPIIYK